VSEEKKRGGVLSFGGKEQKGSGDPMNGFNPAEKAKIRRAAKRKGEKIFFGKGGEASDALLENCGKLLNGRFERGRDNRFRRGREGVNHAVNYSGFNLRRPRSLGRTTNKGLYWSFGGNRGERKTSCKNLCQGTSFGVEGNTFTRTRGSSPDRGRGIQTSVQKFTFKGRMGGGVGKTQKERYGNWSLNEKGAPGRHSSAKKKGVTGRKYLRGSQVGSRGSYRIDKRRRGIMSVLKTGKGNNLW